MSETARLHRNRLLYAALMVGTVIIGLASRKFPGMLFPSAFGKYPGDALWALMVFFGWAIIFPAVRTRSLAAIALGTAFCDELSQIYQAPWINAVRGTMLGHLVLGSTFSWGDLVAYSVGVALGIFFEGLVRIFLPR